MDAAKRGATALDAGNFEEAIKEYTAALRQMPKAVDYYLKRSAAYSRSSPPKYDAAMKDVELALHLAFERARRELIGQAQLRRAILLFNMGQYANAQFVFGFVKKYDKDNKTIPIWETKISAKLGALADDDENKKVTIVERPEVQVPDEQPASSKVETKPDAASAAPAAASKEVVQTPPSQIKHDWYQSKDNVYFTLLAKGVPKDKATIDIEEHSVSIADLLAF